MNNHHSTSKLQSIVLKSGDQLAINGALVTAASDCTLEICPSAVVFTGRRLAATRVRDPQIELYLTLVQVVGDAARFAQERLRLFGLLSQIALEDRSPETAAETQRCTIALLTGNIDDAVESAGELAASKMGEGRKARQMLRSSNQEAKQLRSFAPVAPPPVS